MQSDRPIQGSWHSGCCFIHVCILSQNVPSLMEKTVGTLAVHTVTTNLVTNLMADAFIVVQTASMVNCVIKVNSNDFRFFSNQLTMISITNTKSIDKNSKYMFKEPYLFYQHSKRITQIDNIVFLFTARVMLNQNESSMNCWNVGLIVSLLINFVLISGACLLFRQQNKVIELKIKHVLLRQYL